MSRYLTTLAHLFHSFPKCDFTISSSWLVLSKRTSAIMMSSISHTSTNIFNPGMISKTPEVLSHEVRDPCKIGTPMSCTKPPVYDGCRTIAYGPVFTSRCSLRTLSWNVKKRPRVRKHHQRINPPLTMSTAP